MRLRRPLVPLLAASVLALPLLGGSLTAHARTATTATTALKVTSKAAGASAWPISDAVTVTATGGTLVSASLTAADGPRRPCGRTG